MKKKKSGLSNKIYSKRQRGDYADNTTQITTSKRSWNRFSASKFTSWSDRFIRNRIDMDMARIVLGVSCHGHNGIRTTNSKLYSTFLNSQDLHHWWMHLTFLVKRCSKFGENLPKYLWELVELWSSFSTDYHQLYTFKLHCLHSMKNWHELENCSEMGRKFRCTTVHCSRRRSLSWRTI